MSKIISAHLDILLTLEMPDDAELSDVLSELDYDFTACPPAKVLEMCIEDWRTNEEGSEE